ncbi:MAG TPA: phospholipase A [Casimicrobiaceae bacterium]|nr:phospholipase A [Casimicrobiaceae bacterium]
MPSSTRAATAPEDTELDRQWQLRPHLRRGPFQLLPYRSVYALAHATTAINNSPSSPTRAVGLQDVQLQELEAKVQLSFKSKLVENAFGGATDLWFGYTQQSYWQAANTRYSSPFRETDYEPELIALHPVDAALAGLRMRYAALSVTHESNGRGEVLSRSWNRLIGDIAAETGAWTFHLRPWLRLDPASGARDDNPDIQDFVGRGELIIAYRNEGQVVTLRARHSLRAGARSHGSARLDWAFPLTGSLHGHVQLFRGYGESLIDYNHPQSTLGIGVSFFD